MKKLYESKYIRYELDEERSIFFTYWQAETSVMTIDEYKSEMLKQKELTHTYRPKYMYGDTTHFAYTISTKLQEWINHHIFNEIYEEFEKCAVIVSQDYIAQVSIELAIDENTYTPFVTKYFEEGEEDNAINWLVEDK